MAIDFSRWASSLTAYAQWLDDADSVAGKDWSDRLNSPQIDKVEGAVAEAVVWHFISRRCDSACVNDRPGTGGVDFEFSVGGHRFLVEVTNMLTKVVSDTSGMPDKDLFSGFYGLLTKQIRQKVRGKYKQARKQSELPLLVAVTTLHWHASRACINRSAVEFAMGSPPRITGKLNSNTGAVEGDLYQSTDLSQSVFLSPQPILGSAGLPIAQAKYQPISGFLVCGFGLCPNSPPVFGAINPEAAQPFDPTVLPDIPFCMFRKWPVTTEIGFEWTISENEEQER